MAPTPRRRPGHRHAVARLTAVLLAGWLCILGSAAAPVPPTPKDIPVVLLHGLARSPASMETVAQTLRRAGYRVCNIGYPSRDLSLEDIASGHVAPQVLDCIGAPDQPVHFVSHSMGGILVRQLAATAALTGIRRVVMLAPPNQGSEIIDTMAGWQLIEKVRMPAAAQLGTAADLPPRQLGVPGFEAGVIAGTRTMNPLLSLRIPGEDDGKVSVASARLEGASDFLTIAVSHVFIMQDGAAIEQTLHFLDHGAFRRAS